MGSRASDIVIFGGDGDLMCRKLLPALYYLYRMGNLPAETRIIASARADLRVEEYRALVCTRCEAHLPRDEYDLSSWEGFVGLLEYVAVDVTVPEEFVRLGEVLTPQVREVVYYLATPPSLFGGIARGLGESGLVAASSRLVLEKPLGRDGKSAEEVNRVVSDYFRESRIFRIDHYLGKETVQNLLVLRFANSIFESVWNREFVDHVQISLSEDIGVEERGGYYDSIGALRDMVQNHLLQLLCLVGMEPPASINEESVRDEKLKVLKALRPIKGADVTTHTVRGQYGEGVSWGERVCGYRDEEGVFGQSDTETFVAIRAEVENWRWAGVPFYLRTGKRLKERVSEIVIQFKAVPHTLFSGVEGELKANRLVLRLQPDEGISLELIAKEPDLRVTRFAPVPLNLSFKEAFRGRAPGAYERLLMDVLEGNPTLFMRRDEVAAAWDWIEPILAGWTEQVVTPGPYSAGSWGPGKAHELLACENRLWGEGLEVAG